MGWEDPAPQFLAQTIVKIWLGPSTFQIKRAQNSFDMLGPSIFKSMTKSLDGKLLITFVVFLTFSLLNVRKTNAILQRTQDCLVIQYGL